MGWIASAAAVAADKTFGPQFLDRFDFTLVFQHAMLTILPSALLILTCPAYIYHHARRAVAVDAGGLLWAKLITAMALIGTEVTTSILWSKAKSHSSDLAVVASAVVCISGASLLVMLFVEHRHSYHPSSLLASYLILTMVFDMAKARTHLIRTGLTSIAALCILSICLKAVMIILGEVSKRSLIRDPQKKKRLNDEVVSGFWNRALFVWLNKTLLVGFSSYLHIKDLPDLDPDFDGDTLRRQLHEAWHRVDQSKPHALLKACILAFWRDIVRVVLPKLLYSGFTFAQPFLIQTTLHHLGTKHDDYDISGALIAATFLIFAGRSITRSIADQLIIQSIVKFRGALVGVVLDKSLRLDFRQAQNLAAVSIMSNDVESIEPAIILVHDLWSGVVDIAVGLYVLVTMVKQSTFLAVLPTIVVFFATFPWTLKLIPVRKIWQEAIQLRVTETSRFLGQIKSVKMTGFTPIFHKYLQGLRDREIKLSKQLRQVSMTIYSVSVLADTATPTIVLAGGVYWSGFQQGFTPVGVFPVLSVVSIIVRPTAQLIACLPNLTGSLACLSRVQDFLLLKERKDRRIIGNKRYHRSSNSSSIQSEVEKGGYLHESDSSAQQYPFHCAISFENITVKYSDDGRAILNNVSFEVAKHELNFVVGPVGCGKSTLLHTILGELDPDIGSIYVHDEYIAYSSQVSWIPNLTIRQAIIGYHDFDLTWYYTVLHACCINLSDFPDKDQTRTGSNGVNLSGGQKLRIATARAVYSRAEIMAFDNPMSALDSETARALFYNLFAKETGLLRRMGTTIIIAAPTPEFYSAGEQLLVLNGKGSLQSCRAIGDFVEATRYIPNFDITDSASNRAKDDTKEQGSISYSSTASKREPGSEKGCPSLDDTAHENLELRKNGEWRTWKFIVDAVPLSTYAVWFSLLIVAAIVLRFHDIYVRIWLEKDPGNKEWFIGLPIIMATFFIIHTVFYWHYFLSFVPQLALSLHDKLLSTMMRAKLLHLTSKDSGSLLNKFSQDMTLVNGQLPNVLMQVILFTFMVLFSIGVICSGASYIAVVIPFLIAVLYAITHYYLKTSRQMRHLDLEGKTPLYTHFTEATAGLQHIRGFGWQGELLRSGIEKLNSSQKPYYYMFCIQRWLTLVMDLVVTVLAVLLETFALKFADETSQSATGLALLNLLSFAQQLQSCVIAWTTMETCLGAVSRLQTFMDETPTEDEPSLPYPPPDNWPPNGSIEMTDVDISYSIGDKILPPTLTGISCSIFSGARVAISGPTGSGKSSFMLALLNLIDRTGAVNLDCFDPKDLPPQLLRSRIAIIPQDPVRLPGSVRDNIIPPDLVVMRPEGSADDAEIISVLHGLCIWDHIRLHGGLDKSYDSMSFSDGQRQLVALARAVMQNRLTDTRLVITDEATSHLDPETDEKVQTFLMDAFTKATVLNVTHRENGFPCPDYILDLRGGRLRTASCFSKLASTLMSTQLEVARQMKSSKTKRPSTCDPRAQWSPVHSQNGWVFTNGRIAQPLDEVVDEPETEVIDVGWNDSTLPHKSTPPQSPLPIQSPNTVAGYSPDSGPESDDYLSDEMRGIDFEEQLSASNPDVLDLHWEDQRLPQTVYDPESESNEKLTHWPPNKTRRETTMFSEGAEPISAILGTINEHPSESLHTDNNPRGKAVIASTKANSNPVLSSPCGADTISANGKVGRQKMTSSTHNKHRQPSSQSESSPLSESGTYSGHSSGDSPCSKSQNGISKISQPHIASLAMGPIPDRAKENPKTDKGKNKLREAVVFSEETIKQQQEDRTKIDLMLKEIKRQQKRTKAIRETAEKALTDVQERQRRAESQVYKAEKDCRTARRRRDWYVESRYTEISNADAASAKVEDVRLRRGSEEMKLSVAHREMCKAENEEQWAEWNERAKSLERSISQWQDEETKNKEIAQCFRVREQSWAKEQQMWEKKLDALLRKHNEAKQWFNQFVAQESVLEAEVQSGRSLENHWQQQEAKWRRKEDEWDMKYNRPHEYANLQHERKLEEWDREQARLRQVAELEEMQLKDEAEEPLGRPGPSKWEECYARYTLDPEIPPRGSTRRRLPGSPNQKLIPMSDPIGEDEYYKFGGS